jgi:hypothetical protein
MWWFVTGYVLAAVAFYTYITATAVEEPEALVLSRVRPLNSAGLLENERIGRKAA